MTQSSSPSFSRNHMSHRHTCTSPYVSLSPSRLSQGELLEAPGTYKTWHLQDPAPGTICTWLFLRSASNGVASGAGNSRFLTHSWIRKIFLGRRTNSVVNRHWHLNASPGIGLMRKSQPACSSFTYSESGSNKGHPRGLWTGLSYRMIGTLKLLWSKMFSVAPPSHLQRTEMTLFGERESSSCILLSSAGNPNVHLTKLADLEDKPRRSTLTLTTP